MIYPCRAHRKTLRKCAYVFWRVPFFKIDQVITHDFVYIAIKHLAVLPLELAGQTLDNMQVVINLQLAGGLQPAYNVHHAYNLGVNIKIRNPFGYSVMREVGFIKTIIQGAGEYLLIIAALHK